MLNLEQYKNDLNKLISVKSVMEKGETDAPFGNAVNDALVLFLSLAKNMGFETKNYDGYGGEVVFGEGEEIGIVGHLDVVPEGDGWTNNPFSLTEKDGYLYGRGIMDDKGPMLLCLYALKELKDSKFTPNKKFRLIVGVNEESGWKDVDYIKTKTALPEYGFSPDGDFPVGYAEKGMAEIEFCFPKLKNFHDVKGGTVVNAVCGLAEAKQISPVNAKLINKFKLKEKDGKIISVGKSAHGSRPKEGKNAILPLLKYFKSCGEDVKNIIDCLFLDKYKLQKMKNEQGNITLSPDLIKETKNGLKITCDLRVPAPFTFKTATQIIDKFNTPYKIKVHHQPMMVDKNGFFVRTLLSSYNEVTKRKVKPVSMGGSTFARVFSKGCAFGPEFPLDISTIHGPDERIKEDKLLLTYEIYKSAIFNLAK